jgi:hypothetical protein
MLIDTDNAFPPTDDLVAKVRERFGMPPSF